MNKAFHDDLEALSGRVMEMGETATGLLRCAMDAIASGNTSKAGTVLERRSRVATMDGEIEEEALRLLLLYQPMAGDLRRLATILKMVTYLERVGRYAGDLAKIVMETGDDPRMARIRSVTQMGTSVISMMDDAMTAFAEEDVSRIADMSTRDDKVDSLRYSIFREYVAFMTEDPSAIEPCVNLVMAARYLERCGDHACKISEKVHYMVTGERIDIR